MSGPGPNAKSKRAAKQSAYRGGLETAMCPRAIASALAAGCSRASDEQRQHVCAPCHEGIRRFEVFPQFSLPDE